MKTKTPSLALLIVAGLLLSTAPASASIIYGNTVVNGTTYDLSPGADLSGAYLFGADLSNADLSYANLFAADLFAADLFAANLTNATLTNAGLYYAHLNYADLTNANLSNANLYYADLSYATVSYSNWTDFYINSGALGLGSYAYDTSVINYANAPAVPEPSTYGLIGVVALGLALAARRRKLKTA
jgi:uncharacterized protein YjbI with pentapeptide repeats